MWVRSCKPRLQKTIDTVDHSILLNKLKNFNIIGIPDTWINNYLSNRIQTVNYKGIMSSPLTIKIGVSQGSILGLLLFLLFINDLPLVVSHSNVHLFADDTFLSYSDSDISSINEKMNQDMRNIEHWAKIIN